MEEAIQLSVPLIADENEGVTWYEAKIKNRLLDKKNPLEHYGSKGFFFQEKTKVKLSS